MKQWMRLVIAIFLAIGSVDAFALELVGDFPPDTTGKNNNEISREQKRKERKQARDLRKRRRGGSRGIVLYKPVIYCYNSSDTFSLQVKPKGEFIFTYPDLSTVSTYKTNEDGSVADIGSGKNYPYLFWEAKSESLNFQSEGNQLPGFLIQTDSLISFLENQLASLGLNSTEQIDFITYWGPIMQRQPYALVQFVIDDVYQEEIARLDISPRPDAMRRVFMLYSPLVTDQIALTVVPQQFNSFERFGFTVVEWGGSIIETSFKKLN